MKKSIIRVIALALVFSMFAAVMCSCGVNSVKVRVKVTLSDEYCKFRYAQETPTNPNFIIEKNARTLLDLDVKTVVDKDEELNAIRVLKEACANRDLLVEAPEGALNPTMIGGYSEYRYDPATTTPVEGYDIPLYFYWNLYINGEVSPKSAAVLMVNDGDEIEFRLSYMEAKVDELAGAETTGDVTTGE